VSTIASISFPTAVRSDSDTDRPTLALEQCQSEILSAVRIDDSKQKTRMDQSSGGALLRAPFLFLAGARTPAIAQV
jgi:hypothetical protein